jgi:hypothetical protein
MDVWMKWIVGWIGELMDGTIDRPTATIVE